MKPALRPARREDLDRLTALCLRSKAYWGYDEAFMAACVPELTLTTRDLARDPIIMLEDRNGLAGMAQVSREQDVFYLEKLFVDTDRIGRGYGKQLYLWALETARSMGAQDLVIEADPDAAAFYEKMGAIPKGEAPSGSVAGRVLPRFVHPL